MTPRCTVRHINSCSTSGSGTVLWKKCGTDVQKLIDARVELGLRRLDVTRLTEGIRAAIGFGSDFPSARTEFRYRKVLNIVN